MEKKSRTQIKKEAEALQALGEKLTRLSDSQIDHPAIPDALRLAIRDAKAIHSREARRRQMQYIGRLMRDLDPSAIREMIHDIDEGRRDETALFKQAETWRDGLIRGDDSILDKISGRFPDADRAPLLHLIQTARKGLQTNQGKRASKLLFRALHDLVSERRPPDPNVSREE